MNTTNKHTFHDRTIAVGLALLALGCEFNYPEPDSLDEIICFERDDGSPSCAARIPSTDTWVSHLTRECDPLVPELSRSAVESLPGWLVQQPAPAIVLEPADAWPEGGWFCAPGLPIELGGRLENPRCGSACETCVERCAAELDGVVVMIAPGCNFSLFTHAPADFDGCGS